MDNGNSSSASIDARAPDEPMPARSSTLAAEEKRSDHPEEDERFDKLVTEADTRKARIDKLVRSSTPTTPSSRGRPQPRRRRTDEDSGKRLGRGNVRYRKLIETVRSMARRRSGRRGAGRDRPRHPVRHRGRPRHRDFSDSAVAVRLRLLAPGRGLPADDQPVDQPRHVINADNGRPLILPNLSADPTGYTPGEGTAITESTPTLGTATATPKSYKALSYVSRRRRRTS
jgi:hypothetical protein